MHSAPGRPAALVAVDSEAGGSSGQQVVGESLDQRDRERPERKNEMLRNVSFMT